MLRCECAGLTFEEIEAMARRQGIAAEFEAVCSRTGGGDTCTACRDDLMAFLADRGAVACIACPRKMSA